MDPEDSDSVIYLTLEISPIFLPLIEQRSAEEERQHRQNLREFFDELHDSLEELSEQLNRENSEEGDKNDRHSCDPTIVDACPPAA